MKRTVPLNKQSKRAQRDYYSGMRNDWNGVVPVTWTIPDKKAYDRKRQRCADRRSLPAED